VLMLERFDAWLKRSPGELQDGLWRAWNGRLWGRDQLVRVQDADTTLTGTVLGGSPDGTLVIQTTDGVTRRIVAGELLP